MQSDVFAQMWTHGVTLFFGASVFAALYTIGACLCRIRHASPKIKHEWKLLYVAMLGLGGWALCDLLTGDYTLFQQCVSVAVAAYIRMVKDSWRDGPPPVVRPAPKPAQTYAQVRSHINTGDTIGIQTGTLGGRIIRLGQVIAGLPRSHITHCGIAQWVGTRLMVIEMGPAGNIVKPLSQYAGKRMTVSAPAPGTDLSLFDLGFDHITERHIPYGLLDLVRIGARLLPMRVMDTRGWGGDGDGDKVCSLLPTMLYRAMGGDVSGIPDLASPAEVVQALGVKFEIEG
jgi:hypothetical protein